MCTSNTDSEAGNEQEASSPAQSASAEDVLRVKRARAFTAKAAKKVLAVEKKADGQDCSPNYTLDALPILQEMCPLVFQQEECPVVLRQDEGLSQQELDALCVDEDGAGGSIQESCDASQQARGLPQAELDTLCVVSCDELDASVVDAADATESREDVKLQEGPVDDDERLCMRRRTRAFDREAYDRACQKKESAGVEEEKEVGDEGLIRQIRRERAYGCKERAKVLSEELLSAYTQDHATSNVVVEAQEAEVSSKESMPKAATADNFMNAMPTPLRNQARSGSKSALA
jgi:hypothetical protein